MYFLILPFRCFRYSQEPKTKRLFKILLWHFEIIQFIHLDKHWNRASEHYKRMHLEKRKSNFIQGFKSAFLRNIFARSLKSTLNKFQLAFLTVLHIMHTRFLEPYKRVHLEKKKREFQTEVQKVPFCEVYILQCVAFVCVA